MGRQVRTISGAGAAGIGKGELEVLRYVQDHAPVTVRQVADHLGASRGVVRTTVLNVMARLVRKKFLVRKRVAGVYVYSPKVAKTAMLRELVREFVKTTLGGSVSPFVAYLAQEAEEGVTAEELAELRRLVKELGERKEKP